MSASLSITMTSESSSFTQPVEPITLASHNVSDTQVIGQHLLADFHQCAAHVLSDPAWIEQAMTAAAHRAGATIINQYFHHFGQNQGVTGVLLLKESHMSIHTWPELSYCAIDVFMCGAANVQSALEQLQSSFNPKHTTTRIIQRGTAPE